MAKPINKGKGMKSGSMMKGQRSMPAKTTKK